MTHIYTYLSFPPKIFDAEQTFPYISVDYETQGSAGHMRSLFVHSDVLIK